MRILLVRPPVPRQTIGLKHLMLCEPLELEYVAAGAAGDHDVEILDLMVEGGGYERKLRTFAPDVVGTSAYITGVHEAIRLCRTAKAWNPEVRTVIGGVHASLAPEDFADRSVDVIVRGDGTTVLPEVLRAMETGRPLASVTGLILPDADGLMRTPDRPYMPHPDALPFPRRDLTRRLRHRYHYLYHQPLALLKTTWGCWYRCNFCFNWRVTGGTPFVRSAESLVEELARIEEPEVYIVDDIFLISRARLIRAARLIRERGIRKRYLCFARADFLADNEDLVAEWAELGLSAVLVGLEAATDAELQGMAKGTTVDRNREAVRVLRRCGVDVYASLIPSPDYMPADWVRLQRFIDRNDLYYINVSPLTPLPGTDLWRQNGERITVPRRAHPLWDLSHVVLPTRMPLREFYRALLRVYALTVLDLRRARRVVLRPRPPILSRASLRVWWGVVRIGIQLLGAHRHHRPRALRRMEEGGG